MTDEIDSAYESHFSQIQFSSPFFPISKNRLLLTDAWFSCHFLSVFSSLSLEDNTRTNKLGQKNNMPAWFRFRIERKRENRPFHRPNPSSGACEMTSQMYHHHHLRHLHFSVGPTENQEHKFSFNPNLLRTGSGGRRKNNQTKSNFIYSLSSIRDVAFFHQFVLEPGRAC